MQAKIKPALDGRKYLEYHALSAVDQILIKRGMIKTSDRSLKEGATLPLNAITETPLPQQARQKPRACMFNDVHFHMGG